MKKPIPTGIEIILDENKPIFSRTDEKGIIVYTNQNFKEATGYTDKELIGTPHNIIRHPDMPKAIFFFMWERLKNGKNIRVVIKNLAKNGDHYWVITDFFIGENEFGEIVYSAKRTPAPRDLIEHFIPIYDRMKQIEELSLKKSEGMEESLIYFKSLLTKEDKSYEEYIEYVVNKFSIKKLIEKFLK